MTDDALFVRQKPLQALMRRYARSPADTFRGTSPVPGTEQNAAFLVLGAIVAGPPATIQHRVERLWTAPPRIGELCHMTFQETLGAALTALLSQERLRRQLDYVEFVREYEIFSLSWREVEPSSFGPHTPEEWQAREDDAKRGGLTRIVRLPVQTFDKIAALVQGESDDAR